MYIKLKEGRYIGLTLALLCMLYITSCTKKDTASTVEYHELSEKVKNGEIKYIEIIYSNWSDDLEVSQTIEKLKVFFRYKIVINNLRGGGLSFIEKISKFPPIKETDVQNDDFRLGLLFLDKNNKEIYSMYFSTFSPEVRIHNKMFMAPKGLLESIAPFIPDQEQEFFKKQINSWFPETNEESTGE